MAEAPSAARAPKRAKIAVVVGGLEVGGAELDIVRNFPRLNRAEFDVVIVNFGIRGTLAPVLEEAGIPVIARLGRTVQLEPGRLQRLISRVHDAMPDWVIDAWRAFKRGVKTVLRPVKHVVKAVLSWIAHLRPVAAVLRFMSTVGYVAKVARWVGNRLNDVEADVAHAFLPHSYAYAMFAVMFMRPKTRRVMSRLSLNFYKDDIPWLAWLERHVLHPRLDIGIGNSQRIIDELIEEGLAPEKCRLLYNGIDPEPFLRTPERRAESRAELGIADDAFVAIAVGNLHTYKGHADLIEAASLARDTLPEHWQVLVAGGDPGGNHAGYQRRIDELGLAEHVRLLGPRDDVPNLLAAADVFVHPSHHEGLPNAIIEAMAASLPVIGTEVGGIPELVTDVREPEPTGWLVPPEDPAALSAALEQAATAPALRAEMGARARARVEAQFSLEHSVAAYESIYRELVPVPVSRTGL